MSVDGKSFLITEAPPLPSVVVILLSVYTVINIDVIGLGPQAVFSAAAAVEDVRKNKVMNIKCVAGANCKCTAEHGRDKRTTTTGSDKAFIITVVYSPTTTSSA